MTDRKGPQSSRSEAAKAFALEKRDLTARESEARRLASDTAKTARLRELRLAKEAAERREAPPRPPAKPRWRLAASQSLPSNRPVLAGSP